MSSIEIRPFRRSDREQVTDLVNVHIAAVVPGWSVSVNAVMSQLEREPGEIIVDPWVVGRETRVAVRRNRVVAAAHLLRYAVDDRVSEGYRGSAEFRWLVCWPGELEAGDALASACLEEMAGWSPTKIHADGSLPSPATYGIPDCWPHVRGIYERAGFALHGRAELIFVAYVAELPTPGPPPLTALELHREVGDLGTRFVATLAGEQVGLYEVSADLTKGGTLSALAGWATVDNLHVAEAHRRRGIATWVVGHVAEWLRLAGRPAGDRPVFSRGG